MTAASPGAVLASEWIKVRTVRSTLWTLLLTFALSVGVGGALGVAVKGSFGDRTAEEKANFDPVYTGFQGMTFGQVCLLVFGVLLVSSEYTSGTIRLSLAATPRRGLFFAGKTLVGTAVAALVAVVTAFVTFLTSQAALGPRGLTLQDPDVMRAVTGAALYMTLLCAIAMGVAAMLRSSVLSLGILLPVVFLVSPVLNRVPGVKTAAQYLPDQAGLTLMTVVERDDMGTGYGAGTAVVVLVVWTVLALGGGYAVLRTRDA